MAASGAFVCLGRAYCSHKVVSVALKSGGPNSHLSPRKCKNGDFSCVCGKWKGWQFFESQLQLCANLDISQQGKSIQVYSVD